MNKKNDNKYRKTIQSICDCGNMINDSSRFTELQKNVFRDLLYRIKRNCLCLSKLTDVENDYLTVGSGMVFAYKSVCPCLWP